MEIPNLIQLKEELLELADIITAAIIKAQRPADDEISCRAANAEFGKSWVNYHLSRRNIHRIRLGPHKNSRLVFSRLELLAVKEAERRNVSLVRTKLESQELFSGPGKPKVRKSLFWDLGLDIIEWDRYQKAIIHRVLDRGSENEKREIARFYAIPYKELQSYSSP